MPCDASATVSRSGHRVAAMRRRSSTSCSSGTEIWNGRMVLLSAAKAVRSSVSVKAAAVQAARRARRAGEDGSEDMILLPGCRSALGGDLDDRLGESLRRFLRQIVPDAALDRRCAYRPANFFA